MSEMMWGGRFTKAEEKNALDFNASISYDCRMYREDIAGSIAHAKMLAAHSIISAEDQEKSQRVSRKSRNRSMRDSLTSPSNSKISI